MKTQPTNIARQQPAWKRALPGLVAFVATLAALPIQAVTIPTLPLQTGAAYPAPNIMFILDDSGSMTSDYMPDTVPATSPVNIASLAYTRNTLSYNPNRTYLAWIKSDNTRYTTGTSYTSAWDDDNQPSTAVNLATSAHVFYVPKAGATDMAATDSYYRYEIKSGGGSIVRSDYGTITKSATVTPTGFPKTSLGATSGTWGTVYTITVPANATLTLATSGGSYSGNGANARGADLYARFGSAPTGAGDDCAESHKGNDESCSLTSDIAGTWYVSLDRYSNYSGVRLDASYYTSNRCGNGTGSSDWINCTPATPTGRTLSAELANYAVWYSYHRTRIKTAKAGASEAFSQLGSNLRVGFDSIWNRSAFQIPVASNSGLFTGTNRDTWFARLQAASGSGNTPLQSALQRTGEYYSSDLTASGPWGPETGANQISCRQNFAILTTDGYWNNNTGYTSVGDADGTAGPTVTNTAGQTYTYAPAKPYIDNFKTSPNTRADTLADVSMYYWKRDLVSSLENNVPTSTADPAFWQHMVTFGISIGLQGVLNPKSDLPSITNGSKSWGDPGTFSTSETPARIDDLWHAAVNGRGSFVAATDPVEFAQGLVSALATVAARLGSASNVTANSTSFQTDTRVYQASYVSGNWTGELAAYDASSAGVASTPAWQASSGIPTTGRKVLTWNGSSGATFPTTAQVSALARTGGLAPATGAQNAAYIGGTQTLEKRNGGSLRDRNTVLGDIVDSSPLYVKDSETIFVGANDGMLHAFNALTGAERFAYVPGGINLSDLASLSDPQYSHRYFVDGPIAVSTLAQTPGKNYLVGALGRGGKGVFGLDVTAPATFGASNVLWERSSGSNMGQVLGEPLVVKLNNGVNGVIVSNGINSSSGHATLFVLNIADGSILREIDTGNQGADNGLSAPRGWDSDGNGTVDTVYAGDLKGNLWKFDLSASNASTWGIANGGVPMFVARDASDVRQPITAGLALAQEPSTGKRWVFIGTGSFLTTSDTTDMDTQSMYGVVDDGTVVSGRSSTGDGSLVKRQIVLAGTSAGKPVRGFEAAAGLTSGAKGWYIDLLQPPVPGTQQGERIVSNPRVRGTVLLTASLIPPTSNTCDAGGSGYINALDAFTGTSLSSGYFDANGNGNFNDDKLGTGSAAVPIGSVDLGVGMPTLPTIIDKLLVVGGSNGSLASMLVNPQGAGARRLSWREILKD